MRGKKLHMHGSAMQYTYYQVEFDRIRLYTYECTVGFGVPAWCCDLLLSLLGGHLGFRVLRTNFLAEKIESPNSEL